MNGGAATPTVMRGGLMNRYEIKEEIKVLRQKQRVMEDDLTNFAVELSATSQVAIIARLVSIQQDIEEYKKMLDLLDFDEIVSNQFD